MSIPEKCPHCGSPRTSPLSAYWTCKVGTTQRDEDGRTHLCREREARQKAEKKLAEIRAERDMEHDACNNYLHILAHTKAENQKLREIADDAIKELEELVDNSSLAPAGYVEHLRSQLNNLKVKPEREYTDKCPNCGAPRIERDDVLVYWCGTVDRGTRFSRSLMCKDPMLLPKLLKEIDKLRNIAERAIENCECEPECTSHVGDHCNCLRLARNEQIRTELEAINPTDK